MTELGSPVFPELVNQLDKKKANPSLYFDAPNLGPALRVILSIIVLIRDDNESGLKHYPKPEPIPQTQSHLKILPHTCLTPPPNKWKINPDHTRLTHLHANHFFCITNILHILYFQVTT